MENSQKLSSPSPRQCPTCKRSQPEVKFFRNAEDCYSCIRIRSGHNTSSDVKLDDVERHRQKKLLQIELKKLAKARYAKRLASRRARAAREAKEKNLERILPRNVDNQVEVDAATKEMATRVLQRRRLIEFVKAFHHKYKAGWVHMDICRRLEKFSADVEAGLSPRLMILMPPRHGKSQIASKLFPAWHLGHYPEHEVIACSYNISLALEFSREVREVVRSERYSKLFPKTRINSESQGAEAWKLMPVIEGNIVAGQYVAAGIGGPINGKGAHVLIIDDPIKNAEEADSKETLEKIWNWYISTAYSRLAGEGKGGVLIIQTWWSDGDLAGRLQEAMKEDPESDRFEVIRYPAVAEEDEEFRLKGEALHPERFDLKALNRIKNTQGGDKSRWWNALYQQNPIPDEGAYFTKSMFVYRDERPNNSICYVYQAWDFAIGEKRYNDYTVGVTIMVDPSNYMHVVEMERFRSGDQLRIADSMLDMYARYERVMEIGVEDGQIWRGVRTHLQTRMKERGLWPVIQELRPLTDKTVRAKPLQGRMQQHRVTFPKSGDWLAPMLKEFLRFPAGMHDDTVDAMAWAADMILLKAPPHAPKAPAGRREKTIAEKLKALQHGGLRGSTGHMAA